MIDLLNVYSNNEDKTTSCEFCYYINISNFKTSSLSINS